LYYFFYIFVIEGIFKIIIIKKSNDVGKKRLSERMEDAREARKERGIRRE
jgi:hypothetical protein